MKSLHAVLIAIILVSCAPQPVRKVAPPPPIKVPSVVTQPGESAAGPPARSDGAPVAAPAKSRPFDESILRGREFLLEAPATTGLVVRDPDLGPLTLDRGIIAATYEFFRDAEDGSLDRTPMVTRWESYLQAWAKRFHSQAKGQGRARVGEPIAEPGAGWLVPVKLMASEGHQYAGWINLVPEGDGYLVSDIQIEESPTRGAPFDPESSAYEISSPSLR